VHTLLRLPTGIFYAQGVKANVLFFDRRAGSAQAATRKLWVYDLRTNKHFTLKTKPLQRADLDEFVSLYRPGAIDQRQPTWSEDNPEGRWRSHEVEDLQTRDKTSLDLFWLKDESLRVGSPALTRRSGSAPFVASAAPLPPRGWCPAAAAPGC
jgi:type I restriction enzyme M protein